ncbi:hypothetical protein ET445_16095 [Agromyces protaetiae]|uniref:VWFA domain-containing protein n=1 Tax=Agromyces protaetiae TaxID=2509455 RepID=A0A4P6FKU9_9MICO|nr:hypothetical protein [Agromyces protaetiae]QAY74627.1 hypothetical protein ET445_16095 [Agromyces protaetiae]
MTAGALLALGLPTVAFAEGDGTTPPETSQTTESTETPATTPEEVTTPPAEETTPPAEETTPPAEETTPPAEEETTPPAEEETTPPATTEPPQKSARLLAPEVAPLAAPQDTATIRVHKRLFYKAAGIWTPNELNNFTGNAGAKFQAYRISGNNNTSNMIGTEITDASCTIATDADFCDILIDVAANSGELNGARVFVQEVTKPLGTYANPTLYVGNVSGPTTEVHYPGRTDQLSGGQVYNFPNLTRSSNNTNYDNAVYQSYGVVANSLDNPPVQPKCSGGLNVAIQMDLSSSLNDTQRLAFRNALIGNGGVGQGLLGSLSTSNVALFSFNDQSPAEDLDNWPDLRPVGTNWGSIVDDIEEYTATGGSASTGSTNWDDALREVSNSYSSSNPLRDYDLLLFVTDGAPNNVGPGGTPVNSTNVTVRSLEAAIFSANALKNQGVKVIGVGVGAGINGIGAGLNLRAVSGAEKDVDYFQEPEWDNLKNELIDIVNKFTCKTNVNVTKLITDANGNNGVAGAGWSISATENSDDASLSASPQVTNASGQASFVVSYTHQDGETDLVVDESLASPAGYQFVKAEITHNGVTTTDTVLPIDVPDVAVGDSLSIIIKNTKAPTDITVNKQWVVNDVPLTLNTFPDGVTNVPTLTGPGVPAGAKTFGTKVDLTSNGAVNVNETISPLKPLCSAVTKEYKVGDGAYAALPAGGASVQPGSGSTVVTLKNTVTCTTELTLKKDVTNSHGGGLGPEAWNGKLKAGALVFNHNVKQTVTPGTFTLSEDPVAGYTEASAVQCVGGSQAGGQITLKLGESAVCTFYNKDVTPKLKLVKKVGGNVVPITNWTLSAIPTNDNAPSFSGDGTANGDIWANTTYNLSEAPVNGFEHASEFTASNWSCTGGGSLEQTGTGTAKLTGIALGADITCEITNTAKPAVVTHDKKVKSLTANADGTWTIVYEVTVENPSPVLATTYSLTDTLHFGAGVTVNSASATVTGGPASPVPGWNGGANTTLAPAGTSIAADGTHVYTITANAKIAAGTSFASDGPLDCQAEPGNRAFRNVATLNGQIDKADCAEPTLPTVEKLPGTATPVAGEPGQWDVAYTIKVTNTTPNALWYTASDLPANVTLPAGVTLVSGPTGVPVGAISIAAGSPGNPTVNQHPITVRVKVGTDATLLNCDAKDGGVINSATITSSNQDLRDSACVSIPKANIAHDKVVVPGSVVQGDDGKWSIQYKITVKSTGPAGGLYDLSDSLQFANGITYASASATGPGGAAIGGWNGSGVLADDAYIGPSGSPDQVYTITVTGIDVPEGVIGNADKGGVCPVPDGSGKKAFNNEASLTSGGQTVKDYACDSPTKPTVKKTWTSTDQDIDSGTWNVTYKVEVDNSNGKAGYYWLTEVPNFDPAVTINSWTVKQGDTVVIDDQEFTDGVIVPESDQAPIGANAKVTYTVTFNVSAPPGYEATCEPREGGLFNGVDLYSGHETSTDDDCGKLEGGVPTVAKTVTKTQQLPSGDWKIEYDVTVTGNPTYTTFYNLDDTLEFGAGITPTSASWTSAGGNPASGIWSAGELDGDKTTTLATNRQIGLAPAAHVYHVTVIAQIAKSAYSNPGALDCQVGDNEDGTGFRNVAILYPGTPLEQQAADCSSPSTPTVKKTVTSPVTASGSSWKVGYTITVENSSDTQALVYDLDDVLDFPTGATITARAVTSKPANATIEPNWINGSSGRITNDVELPGDATHTYVIEITFKTGGDQDVSKTFKCESQHNPHGKGALNGATVISGTFEDSDEDCADIPVTVEVHKTWKLNGRAYDVDDAAKKGLTATLTLGTPPTGKVWDTVYSPYEAGSKVKIGEKDVRFPDGCKLDESKGLGEVTLTKPHNEFDVFNFVECKPIPGLVKKEIATSQQPNGEWVIIYQLTVSNDSTVVGMTYDLKDSLSQFGAGITPVSASWVGPGPSSGSWNLPNTTTTLANDKILGPDSQAVYTVTVRAKVSADAWDGGKHGKPGVKCLGGEKEGGFNNVGTLEVDHKKLVASDCSEPGRATVEKHLVKVDRIDNPNDPNYGNFKVDYVVTVTNASSKGLYYDLHDQLGFPDGVQIVSAHATAFPPYNVSAWNGQSVTKLADGRIIAAQSGFFPTVHTYGISVIANVSHIEDIDDVKCVKHESGKGFFNQAALLNGTVLTKVDDCDTIPVGLIRLNKVVDNSAFDGKDLPAPPLQKGDWNLTGKSPLAEVTEDGDDGISFVVPAGNYALSEAVVPARSGSPLLPYYHAEPWVCTDTPSGDAVGTVKVGKLTDCTIENVASFVDVSIEKSYVLPDGETAIEAGTPFDFVLEVTNNSSQSVAELDVTDLIDPELDVTGPATFVGQGTWTELTPADDSETEENESNAFAAHGVGPFEPGLVVTITIPVVITPVPVDLPPAVGPDDPAPTPPAVNENPIPNRACVSLTPPTEQGEDTTARGIQTATFGGGHGGFPWPWWPHDPKDPKPPVTDPFLGDLVPVNDCDDVEVPRKWIQPNAYVRCIADVPWLYYDVQVSDNVAPEEITVTWTSADGSLTKEQTIPWDARSGRFLWPGAAVDENGIPYEFPGWRPITEQDLITPPTPGDRFLDLILDETVPTYPWRDMVNPATITFSINPSESVLAAYPMALPTCAIDRPEVVNILKSSSVTSAVPGSSFEYTLSTTATGTGAAENVTLFDEIPADLRVDEITTAGAPAFPRYENCAVTGQDAAGYGGTLRCDLLGVLGQNYPTAPDVVLAVTLNPRTTASSETNTGELCYVESGDVAAQVLCDESTVVVRVPHGMPATGFAGGPWVWGAAGLIVLGGIAVVYTITRRRKDGTQVE